MKVFVDWIGCRLNQSEIEQIAAQLRVAGHEILASPENADFVVINTCAVTNQAAADSRQKARQAWRAGAKEVVLTGCWVTMDEGAARELPGVQRIFTNSVKDRIVTDIFGGESSVIYQERSSRQMLPGHHRRTRAFIKAQDGCDNHCTFCITRLVRGKSQSVGYDKIYQSVVAALAGGAKEIVFTGVQLGAWGKDFSPQLTLRDLISKILERTDAPRLRLSSVEPWDLDNDFFDLWKNKRMCPHLHLPLQSGCGKTLHRMARNTTPEQYLNIIKMALAASPDMAITTDVIVGFPGESDDEFEQSRTFIEAIEFSGGHVFTYSPRPLTPALKLEGTVSHVERKRRSAIIRNIFTEKTRQFQERFLERTIQVLWEDAEQSTMPGKWQLNGLTGNYLRVLSVADENMWNRLSMVLITELCPEGLRGIIVS